MTTRTPEQVAQQTLDDLDLGGDLTEGVEKTADDLAHAVRSGWIGGDTLLNMIHSAIETDRAQRTVSDAAEDYKNGGFTNTVAAALYDSLTDRDTEDAALAAEWVAENENDALWDRFIGPLLDEIEKAAR